MTSPLPTITVAALLATLPGSGVGPADDRAEVARLDTAFQLAIKHNDIATVDATLHPDYVLVLGDGRVITRERS